MTDAPNKLADAVEAFLAAYRAKYRRTQGGVRSNAPFQTEAGEMAVALGKARAVPQPQQEPTPDAISAAEERARAAVIEEVAKIADQHAIQAQSSMCGRAGLDDALQGEVDAAEEIAEAIRALLDPFGTAPRWDYSKMVRVGTRPDGDEYIAGCFVRGLDLVDRDGTVIGIAPYKWYPKPEAERVEQERINSKYLRSNPGEPR